MWHAIGAFGSTLFGHHLASQRQKKQQMYTRDNMDYASHLRRKDQEWYKNEFTEGRLTPWELGGVSGLGSGAPAGS